MTGGPPIDRRQLLEHLARRAEVARLAGRTNEAATLASVARDVERNRQRDAATLASQVAALRDEAKQSHPGRPSTRKA